MRSPQMPLALLASKLSVAATPTRRAKNYLKMLGFFVIFRENWWSNLRGTKLAIVATVIAKALT
ncbi:MAG TPA: hypothetical protein VN643_05860 [Pyrinomonadaceae bacterium]|nr:hypothetical protein [Pyrinomonadaceae bacterium]